MFCQVRPRVSVDISPQRFSYITAAGTLKIIVPAAVMFRTSVYYDICLPKGTNDR